MEIKGYSQQRGGVFTPPVDSHGFVLCWSPWRPDELKSGAATHDVDVVRDAIRSPPRRQVCFPTPCCAQKPAGGIHLSDQFRVAWTNNSQYIIPSVTCFTLFLQKCRLLLPAGPGREPSLADLVSKVSPPDPVCVARKWSNEHIIIVQSTKF